MEKRVELTVHFLVDDYPDAPEPIRDIHLAVENIVYGCGGYEAVVGNITINGKNYPEETASYM